MNLQDTNGMERAEWYEIRRNELLALLARTSEIDIPESEAVKLASIRKKCLENQFEIVLVGEFQGGKSTTFNALCDGRDLSPRGPGGGGVKTSAAIISAQNISDEETLNGMGEWAEITFKSKYEIQKGMFDILHEQLYGDEDFCKTIENPDDLNTAESFATILDLDKPVHRNCVKKALNLWWEQWEKDKSSLGNDIKDILNITTLQERFYGSADYKELLKLTSVGIYDFQSLIAFPKDWSQRWRKGKEASFSLKEVAFIFITRTLLRIRSENLSKLGCRITDCPGLFANAYDSSVARKAIHDSDAIWYLIAGDKSIGEMVLNILEEIRQMGEGSKIVASVNLLKGNHRQLMEIVFPAIENTLHESGFEFPLKPYNAKLAFLSNQGKRISEHNDLSDYEKNCMQIDADSIDADSRDTSVEDMWVYLVNDAGARTGLKELKELNDVSSEAVSVVRHESNIDEIMTFLAREIIAKEKTRKILIENGSQKAVNALQEYEGKLLMGEDAAKRDEEEWKQKVDECVIALNDFIKKSEEIIDNSTLMAERESLSKDLALELVQQAMDEKFIQSLSVLIQESIERLKSKFYFFDDNYIQAIVTDISQSINQVFKVSIFKVLKSWQKGRSSSEAWNRYKRRLSNIDKAIKNSWNTDVGTKVYIKNIILELPTDTTIQDQLEAYIQKAIFDKDNGALYSFIKEVKSNIFTALLNRIKEWWEGDISSEQEIATRQKQQAAKIASIIRPKIQDDLNFQAKISENYFQMFNEMQADVIKCIQNAVNGLLTRFNESVDSANRNLSEAENKRKEIAENNHQIRVGQIEPLRIEIQEFEAQVSKEIDSRN